MALTVTAGGTGNSVASGTTLAAVQLGVTFAVGDILVICVAADNAGSGGAVTNMATPALTATGFGSITTQQNAVFDNGAASAGSEVAIITAVCTIARLSTDTFTLNFTGALTSKCCVVWKVTAGTNETPQVSTSGVNTGSTTGTPTMTTGSIAVNNAVIGCVANESNAVVTADADTTNGSWSAQATATANTGTLLTSMRVASQSKVQTTTPSTQTYNPTMTSCDTVGAWISFVTGGSAAPSAITLATVNTPAPTATGDAVPTVAANTADATNFIDDTTPTVEFTGTDTAGHDLRYTVQILGGGAYGRIDGYYLSFQSNKPVLTTVLAGECFLATDALLTCVNLVMRAGPSMATGGTLTVQIFASTGTPGTNAVPTGSALATSSPVNYTDLSIDSFGFSAYAGQRFNFPTPLRLVSGTTYFVVIDATAVTGGTTPQYTLAAIGDPDPAKNFATFGGGVWNADTSLDIMFEVQGYTQSVLLTKVSNTDAGFVNTVDGADTDPFTTGQKVSFTVQPADALIAPGWYTWQARARDPAGTDLWGAYSTARSFYVRPTPEPPVIAHPARMRAALR